MRDLKQVVHRFTSMLLTLLMILTLLPLSTFTVYAATSGTLTGLTNTDIGLSYSGTGEDAWTASGTTIIGKVKSTAGACRNTDYNSTLTITNNKETEALLSFDYAIEQNKGTIKVGNTEVTTGSSYSAKIEAGKSVNIYIKSSDTTNATKITLSNISLMTDSTVTVTFQPAEHGSYTVDGVALTAEMSKTQSSLTAYSLAATPDDGYIFLGWYDVTNSRYVSLEATSSLRLDNNCNITAKFGQKESGRWETGEQVFTDLDAAVKYAQDNSISKITLLDNAVLSGSHTIPNNITVLIPYDSGGTLYTTTPEIAAQSTAKATDKSEYVRLTLADNASLIVNGGISVGGRYRSAAGSSSGYMAGAYGRIQMNSGSTITVKEGGALYAWGFVTGCGAVTVESGGKAYEWFQVTDFRGGSITSVMINKVFPFNQYYIQNVEVPLTFNAGASETVYTGIYASSKDFPAAVNFIGSSGMFNVASGSMTKSYDGNRDRMTYEINGTSQINSLSLTLMGMNVDSSKYVLPITNNMIVNVDANSTLTVNQTAALLPGVEVNIADTGTLDIANGKTVYVYDSSEWGKYACNAQFNPIVYAPGNAYSRTVTKDIVDAKVNVNGTLVANGSIYTTASGANICSEGTGEYKQVSTPGTDTTTYMYNMGNSNSISITNAKLHNGSQYADTDDEYTSTADATAGTTYYYHNDIGKWSTEEVKTATVTYDSNGGTGTMAAQTLTSGIEGTLTSNTFTKDGYTFSGWNTAKDGTGTAYADGASVTLTEDTTLYAQWTANTYTINWNNADGTVLKTDTVAYGEIPSYSGDTPTKEADAQYTYTFKGWSPEVTSVTGDTTYTATYDQTLRSYTVTWKNDDGTVMETDENVSYGTTPEYNGETPTKSGTDQYSYAFKGWSPAVSTVTGDVTYTAEYTENTNSYTVTWNNADGTTLKTDTVAYGETPSYSGDTPTKEADAQYIYTFKGWSPEITSVTGNQTYTAVYDQTLRSYTVTWKNDDGTELKIETVNYGETPSYTGDTPTKAQTDEYTYIFSGWNPTISTVTGDVTYTAQFAAEKRTYTITWKNDDGTVISTVQVAYGETPTFSGDTPTKASTEQYEYAFTGWKAVSDDGTKTDIVAVTGDAAYTAQYESNVRKYTISWKNSDGSELKTEQVEYGKTPSYDGTPSITPDAHYTATFKEWTPTVSSVTADATYTAVYELTGEKHTVTFEANGGTGSMDQQTFEYGKDTALTTNAFTRENYKFDGWNTAADGTGNSYAAAGSISTLTEDITLYAQWKIQNGWLTDSIGTTYYKNGEIAYYKQWATIDSNDYYFKADGYIVRGLSDTITGKDGSTDGRYVFDVETGKFLSNQNGLYDSGEDTYWIKDGMMVENAGLIKVKKDNDEINYYYFAKDGKAYKATDTQTNYLVEKTNDLTLPGGINYPFGTDGVIKHFDDTSINGIYYDSTSSNCYYCIDGVVIANGLMKIDGNYYYARTSSGALVCNQKYWITRTNKLLDEGIYEFNEKGQIVFPAEEEKKNGIISENGSLYYYVDGKITGAGLIKIGDNYYYVKTSTGEVVHGKTYWITVTNNLDVESGQYQFDDDGKLVFPAEEEKKNGIVSENGSLYYYVDGKITGAGLIKIDGNYYYVRTSSGEVVHGRNYWITVTNDLPVKAGQYQFDADGKMLIN